jgi:drug/metabolite transporter (DMT)-like permease
MMSALVRFVGDVVPVGQVVFFRSAFAIVPVLTIYAWRGEIGAAVRTGRPLGHLTRGLISVASMFLNFAALARLPLVDATAVSFAAPFITVALAAFILGERVHAYRWSAVVVGFCGVVVMLWPYLDVPALIGSGSTSTTVGALCAIISPRATAMRRLRWWRRSTTRRCCGLSSLVTRCSARFRPSMSMPGPPSSPRPACS